MTSGALANDTLTRRPRSCEPWFARAFGVELALDFDAPALRDGELDEVDDPTALELVYAAGLDGLWRGAATEPLGGMVDESGASVIDIRTTPEHGVLFAAKAHGRYLIGPDARHVACAPPAVAEWYWQRMLVGQVLPLVAALRGLEVIHASALSFGDRAIAIAGAPGAGKSTLALELALRGHALLAEDVVALRAEHGRVMAEPGVALVNLLPTAAARSVVERAGLRVLGESHKIHVQLPRAASALPLSALYLLDPVERGSTNGRTVTSVPSPSPADFIGTSFVPYLTGSEYLQRHLAVAGAMADSMTVARVAVDPAVPPGAIADEIEAHAR